MAARFWVTGGTGNWNSTTNWSATSGGASGASVPGSADTAALDASSGSGTVTLDISPDIQTLTCTGFTGTLAFGTNTISLNSTGTIFTGATTMTVAGTPLIILTNSSATSRTITPGAVTEANSISFRITAGTGTLSLTSGSYRDLDFTDGTNPTGYGGALSSTNSTVYGNLKVSTGMTVTAGTTALTFAATSGIKTINTAGVTFSRNLIFNGIGGIWQLQGALTSGTTRTCLLGNGSLDLNGYTLTIGLFSSSVSSVRVLAFGATGKLVLTGTAGNVLSMSTATNFTYTGTSRIELTTASGAGRTIIPPSTDATESNVLNIYVTAGADTVIVSGAARFLNFDLTGFSGTLTYASSSRYFGNLVFSSGMTLGTIASTFVFARTSGSQIIRTEGKTIETNVTIDAPGTIVSLYAALTLGSTRTLTMTNGTLKLKNGVTSTVGTFATSGTNQKFLQSTTPGSQATISAASGAFYVTYLTIQDSNATGGATWDALSGTNVNAGNNNGWNFFYAATLSEGATGADTTSSRPLWELIQDAPYANWQNIPTA